jgi:phytoene/squalene synthetase
MELYTSVSYELARALTVRYSTSFSSSSKLFPAAIRRHIYAIYGLVRIADEVVDTYGGADMLGQLDNLEKDTYTAWKIAYSANPIVHAFITTARAYDIDQALVVAFFHSMRMDTQSHTYTQKLYDEYIYGSAEVIGLMCLAVFCEGDDKKYERLAPGARRLGAGYQKVNFLRDIASDHKDLKRWYFPSGNFADFDDVAKHAIIADIQSDFDAANNALLGLPKNIQPAIELSRAYYQALLDTLTRTPARDLKKTRVRVNNGLKAGLLVRAHIRRYA